MTMRAAIGTLRGPALALALVGCIGDETGDPVEPGDPSCVAFAEALPPAPHVEQLDSVTVETLAGSSAPGKSDGVGAAATFYNPVNLLLEPGGDLIVADFDNGSLRRVTEKGMVATVAKPGSEFRRPFGLSWLDDTLYVQTDQNPDGSFDRDAGSLWIVDVPTGDAKLILEDVGRPRGLAPRGDSLAMADVFHHAVRLYDPATDDVAPWVGSWDCPGFLDGSEGDARFEKPYGIAVDLDGDLVIADRGNHAIRRITKSGEVVTIAGTGSPGMVDGPLDEAHFTEPIDVAIDGDGRIYVADLGSSRVRRIDEEAGEVVTIAGSGERGFADGRGEDAQFYGLEGIEVTLDGRTIYVADGTRGEPGERYHRVRKITLP